MCLAGGECSQMTDIIINIFSPPSTCTSWGARVVSGLHLKCTCSCPPSLRLLQDVWRPVVWTCVCSLQGILWFAVWRRRAGWENWARLAGALARHPLSRPRLERRNSPLAWPARGNEGSSSCTAVSATPGTVQKAMPHAPSRRTKGHIDWFVGAFPGVLYISLPCHHNEEAECTEEGRGRHTSIRVGFLHLINQDFN